MRTERLLFAPWTEADWLALKPIATDPEVMHYISDGGMIEFCGLQPLAGIGEVEIG